jgi:ferredoxin
MFGRAKLPGARRGHASCSGCSLCLLVCPVWRQTHDPRMTPEGRAKALQHGATPAEISESVQSCTLCGACEPVCPEDIDLIGMTLDLRSRLADAQAVEAAHLRMNAICPVQTAGAAETILIPGSALGADPKSLLRFATLIGATAFKSDLTEVVQALEAGIPIPQPRLDDLLDGLRHARTIVVEDGLWLRHLRTWLPEARLIGLGEALSSLVAVRQALRSTDLYVIESRAYHADYQRLVKHYDRLRAERGCAFNLDLQRIAIPPHDQADWILKGRKVERIVVERLEDAAPFRQGLYPVVHVAELADH